MYLKKILLILLLPLSTYAAPQLADSVDNYYGDIDSNEDLRQQLHETLTSYHISQQDGPDLKVSQCDLNDSHCYRHLRLSYKKARQHLFGDLYLKGTDEDSYYIISNYCQKKMTNDDFPGSQGIGPMKIPAHNILNAEHVWPQSRFSNHFSKSLQKGDLHHLMPTLSKVNNSRGNMPFGEVETSTTTVCAIAQVGHDNGQNRTQFEPGAFSKGNVARAVFYFALRYNLEIDDIQESYLRSWNTLDPVDFDEIERHEKIFSIEYVRNPFIDKPTLIDEIENF